MLDMTAMCQSPATLVAWYGLRLKIDTLQDWLPVWLLSSCYYDIRCILGVACVTDKVREARLRSFWHVQCREEEDRVRRILEADVRGQRSGGRQRKSYEGRSKSFASRYVKLKNLLKLPCKPFAASESDHDVL